MQSGVTLHNRLKQLLIRHLPWLVLLVVLLLSAVVRYGLLNVPLERDEGEYAYGGQLLLQGILPYEQIYNMKLPGIYVAYAGILAVFGQTHRGIHFGLLLINAISIVLIFMLAKQLVDSLAGVVAAASFAVLSISQSVQGVFANAEHLVILPVVGGLLLLLRALDDDQSWLIFFSGLLLGIGFLIKQHGAAFIAFGGMYVLIDQIRKDSVDWFALVSRCVIFIIGAVLPYGLTCLVFFFAGLFEKFWFWTVEYAGVYISQVPIERIWSIFLYRTVSVIKSNPLIWVLVYFGLAALIWDKRLKRKSMFIAGFALFSFLAICPGFYFRPHYFIFTLPAAALLVGIAISALANKLSNVHSAFVQYGLPILIIASFLTISVYHQRKFLFQMSPMEISRATYGHDPFPESLEIAKFIREHTKENDTIAVIGSEPQIYFYSGRHSATGHIYMYGLAGEHKFALQMQEELVQEIESAQPKFIVFVKIGSSWGKRLDAHKILYPWFQEYHSKYYKLVGLVDYVDAKPIYHWAPNKIGQAQSDYWISILERKNEVIQSLRDSI